MNIQILLANIDVPGQLEIETYIRGGGYRGLRKALTEFTPDQLIEEVKKSGLRGRGGAGFPTGLKWSFVPKDSDKPTYLCTNADEGEPGTFKDRVIIEKDPHLLIEGIAIASCALKVKQAYIYIRGEMTRGMDILNRAVTQAREKGFLGRDILGSGWDLDIVIHPGAGAYICGEETALLESLEGKRGHPRVKPPFPAVVGLYNSPTVINNVETLANLPAIVNNRAAWFAGIGTEKSAGTKLFCLSGHINRPGVVELPMGVSLRELIDEHGGGMKNGGKLKAVIPGGSSTPVLTADEIDVNMDFESLAAAGTMLGSGGVIVMDDSTCMVWALANLAEFYAHESCGQCTPCREGVPWMRDVLARLEAGRGRADDLDILMDVAGNISGNTVCPLGDAAAMPVESFVTKFLAEFKEHIDGQCCPLKAQPLAKVASG